MLLGVGLDRLAEQELEGFGDVDRILGVGSDESGDLLGDSGSLESLGEMNGDGRRHLPGGANDLCPRLLPIPA